MKLTGYKKRVYDLIRQSAANGINTNQIRNYTSIVDVPAVVSQLNKNGYGIISKRQRDGTATYFLKEIPKTPIRYEFVGDKAIAIFDNR